MSSSQSVLIDSLLLDLFQELRKAGMALTLEQYDLLQQAVAQGYGLGGWQDFKRVCRLLLVKPCANYDANIFDRTTDCYIQQHHDKFDCYIQQHDDKISVQFYESVQQEPQLNLPETPQQEPQLNLPETPQQEPQLNLPETPQQEPQLNLPETPQQEPQSNLPETPQQEPQLNLPEIPHQGPQSNLPEIPHQGPQSNLPETPVGIWRNSIKKPSKVASAFKTKSAFYLRPTYFPIQLEDIQENWRLLRQAKQVGWDYELDIEATLCQIEREGIFADVVRRPIQGRRTELLLLVDDSPAMIPFFPAFQPFIQAIEEARITPAQIYRFTSYPDEYLYHWQHPVIAQPLIGILPKLHRQRTVVLILSDAGAATATYSQERIEGISKFLAALSPCIRQLIWLNPLPPQRWEQTSAWTIDAVLNGKMLTYEPASLRIAARAIPQENMIKTWQMYSYP